MIQGIYSLKKPFNLKVFYIHKKLSKKIFLEIPDLYDFAEVHYKPFKSHDKGMYFQMLREKC